MLRLKQTHDYKSEWSFLNNQAQREYILKVARLGEKRPSVRNICKLIAAGDPRNRNDINKKPLATSDIRKKVYPILEEKRPIGVCFLIKGQVNSLLMRKRPRMLKNSLWDDNRVQS